MTSPAEERPTAAPPVVAVMVVHEPGDWFSDAVASLAEQDYPNLQLVALLTGATAASTTDEIRARFPAAIIRHVEGNPGFGPVANQVLSLVDGRDGFFLVLHDDVSLRSDAVSSLVEEAFRSNAAVVGPKLVEWDAPDVLQHVGLDADRSGETVDVVDPGERDQEQHDAVRDVFALPSACLLIRNDVFRDVSGFAPNIPFLGEDLDLCWRVHLLGARVVVNPTAAARHRGGFSTRATLLNAMARRERHRVRTAMMCSSFAQLPAVFIRLLVGSLLEVVLGLFNGRYQQGLAGLRAVAALPVDAALIVERRRALRPLRRVPGREVSSLMLRSSARLAAFARHRRAMREQQTSEVPTIGAPSTPVARATTVVGLVAAVVVLIGNRGFIWGGLSGVGQSIPLMPDGVSPFDALRDYVVGWSPGWFGTTGSAPTYVGALAVLGAVFLGNWAGLLTAIFVGSFFVAAIGAWRLCGAIGDSRVRMFGALVYTALPIGVLAARDGRRDAIIVWALLPWIVDFSRRIAGLSRDERDVPRETSVRQGGSRRSQLMASLLLLVAGASIFNPVVVVVVAFVALLIFVASLFTATPWRASAWFVVAPLGAVAGAAVLNVPWFVRFVNADWWETLVGPPKPSTGASLVDVLSFGVDNVVWRWALVATCVPVVVMAVMSRGARAAWPTRAAVFVAVPTALRLAHERALLDVRLPEPLILSSIVALGVTLAASAAFADFVVGRTRSLTWRQLAATLSVVGIIAACAPTVVASASGRWSQPADTLGRLVGQLPGDASGDYAVLYIGDSRLLPMSAVSARVSAQLATQPSEESTPISPVPTATTSSDIAYGVLRDGGATGLDALPPAPSTMTSALDRAVQVLTTGESLRAGRLLAPLAVRFIVVPLRDSTLYARRVPLDGGVGDLLVARLSDQLDLRRVYTATDLVIFENAAALPTVAVLDERSAVSSQQATEATLLAEPLVVRELFVTQFSAERASVGTLEAGTVHVAVPFSDRWSLRVDGASIPPRVAFGTTTAFDAPVAGEATLRLAPSTAHRLLVALQLALWILVLAVTFNPTRFRGRVRAAREVVEVSLRSDDQRVGVS